MKTDVTILDTVSSGEKSMTVQSGSMTNVDEGPSKGWETDVTILDTDSSGEKSVTVQSGSMTNVDDGPSKGWEIDATILDTCFSGEKEIEGTKIELILKQSRINTWCRHPISNYCEDDRLLNRRKMVLDFKKLPLRFPVPKTLQGIEAGGLLEKIIPAARIIHLDWLELYFAEEDNEWGPFSLRNELEALQSILSSINSISTSEYDAKEALAVLQETVISYIVSLGNLQHEDMTPTLDEGADVDAAKELLAWGKEMGMSIKLDVACFQEAGRGLVASEDIKIGDVTLEVPMDLVISGEFMESDLLHHVCFEKFNIHSENKRLLWIMKEMGSPRDKFQQFFGLLSEGLNSGVFFDPDAEWMLDSTPLRNALAWAKTDLRHQFRTVIEPIMKEYGALFKSCTFDAFESAWALWNSCSVSIVFPGEKLEACLVPVAGFFNHSQCPHVLYGKHVSSANTIQFIASRPCNKGQQCYLSYGNLSGAEFVTFYGFVPKEENYHEVISFAFGDDFRDECILPLQDKRHWSCQKARGKWLYSGSSGLTKGLVEHVKAVMTNKAGNRFTPSDDDAYRELLQCFTGRNISGCKMTSLDPRNLHSTSMKVAYDYWMRHFGVLADVIYECSIRLGQIDPVTDD